MGIGEISSVNYFQWSKWFLCYGSHPQLRGEQLCRLQTFLNEDLGPHCSLTLNFRPGSHAHPPVLCF